jgi:choline dehydrogenase
VNVTPPKRSGEIRLRTRDPNVSPVIDYSLLGDRSDLTALVAAAKFVERIYAAPALARHVVGRNAPSTLPENDTIWEDFIRATIGIGYHPVGSCRMGADERSVVDPSLRVRGAIGLRVIDASIIPTMPSANTNAAAMMVAEKGADLIIGRPPPSVSEPAAAIDRNHLSCDPRGVVRQ